MVTFKTILNQKQITLQNTHTHTPQSVLCSVHSSALPSTPPSPSCSPHRESTADTEWWSTERDNNEDNTIINNNSTSHSVFFWCQWDMLFRVFSSLIRLISYSTCFLLLFIGSHPSPHNSSLSVYLYLGFSLCLVTLMLPSPLHYLCRLVCVFWVLCHPLLVFYIPCFYWLFCVNKIPVFTCIPSTSSLNLSFFQIARPNNGNTKWWVLRPTETPLVPDAEQEHSALFVAELLEHCCTDLIAFSPEEVR